MVGTDRHAAEGLRVFVSYRREDASGHALALYERLVERFGNSRVFMDIDTIRPGTDFADVIEGALNECDVLLALIGKNWLAATDPQGRRRIDKANDFVRLELEAALRRSITVIPLLIQKAEMPDPEELPESLSALTRRQALDLSDHRWRTDVAKLIEELEALEHWQSSERSDPQRREHGEGPERLKPQRQQHRQSPERQRREAPGHPQDEARSGPRTSLPSHARPVGGPRVLVHGGIVSAVAFSPDGRTLASAGSNGTVRLWDRTGAEPHTLIGHGTVSAVAFAPDGRTLATTGGDGKIRLWDTDTRTELRVLTGHTDFVSALAFTPDGRTLASGASDGTIRLWDPATGATTRILLHRGIVCTVAFAADGRTLAGAGADGAVRLWDPTATEPRTLIGHTDWVNGLAFAPNWRALASAGADGTVRLWDPISGTQLHTLRRHHKWDLLPGSRNCVQAVSFAPEGRSLVSAGRDKIIRHWDVGTATELQALTGHTGWVNALAFTPDGGSLASGATDGTVRLWAFGA